VWDNAFQAVGYAVKKSGKTKVRDNSVVDFEKELQAIALTGKLSFSRLVIGVRISAW
jgi:hypothetical protein